MEVNQFGTVYIHPHLQFTDFHVAFFSGFAVSTIFNYSAFTILMRFTARDENPKYGRRRVTVLLGLMITLPTIFIAFILHNVFCVEGGKNILMISFFLKEDAPISILFSLRSICCIRVSHYHFDLRIPRVQLLSFLRSIT